MEKSKTKKIPMFKNDEEEAKFWESHSVADYWHELEKSDVEFVKKKKEVFTLRMEPRDVKMIGKIAEIKGLQESSLVRMWIKERLYKEVKKSS